MREVYAIQHNKTKRIYIGSSGRTEHRLHDHLKLLRRGKHENKLMQDDYNKYGEDYSFYKLDEIPSEFESYREYFWMSVFNTYSEETGYNQREKTRNPAKLSKFKKIEPYNRKPTS